ncbi:hypothetical protein AYI69_g5635 [Smittium culicis]|uniref:Uncharacterized protein n=1 Tax=Smittium culicis TaxID=133412 RepID=A0A1R1Y4N6_9FUNG|nr:hypothetical protein AYI69_g5635 [Smittium culicis]
MDYTLPPLKDTSSSAVKKTDSTFLRIAVSLESKGMDTSNDPKALFSSTMRALFSEIAATLTQERLDNILKGFELPRKPTQLTVFVVIPLVKKKVDSGDLKSSEERGCLPVIQVKNRGNSVAGPGIVQPAIHDTEEDWRHPNRPQPPEANPLREGTELQDGDAEFQLQNVLQEEFP